MTKIITLLTFLLGFNASAGLISVDISDADVDVDDIVSVTINAVGFELTDMFEFDFEYDNSLFNFDSASLSSELALFDGLAPWLGLEVLPQTFGLSFDFNGDFSAPVGGNFVLASFNLTAIAPGQNTFAVTNSFDYSIFDSHDIEYTSNNNISVAVKSVPEPTSVALFLLAGLALLTKRKLINNH